MTSTNTRDGQDLANPKTFKERDEWMRALVESGLPHGVVRLAVRLALHLYVESGRCDPHYAMLATELRLSRRSIIRGIAVLERAGWVSVARVGQHLHQPNQFSLLRADRGDTALSPRKAATGVTNSADRGDKNRHSGVTYGVTQQSVRTAKNSGRDSLSPDSASHADSKTDARSKAADGKERRGHVNADEGFTAFWEAYPKRVEKVAALKAFAAAVKRGVDPETLIAGAKRYAIEQAEKNPDYTKHPATWINKGCWDDEASGAPVLDNDGNVIAIAARRRGPKSMTENGAELLHEMGYHQEAQDWLEERGYGRA
jgi:hypothetical protein